jgi:uncharacterized protein (TIGR02466 family)
MNSSNVNDVFPIYIYESIIPSHNIENPTILQTVKKLVESTPLGWGYKWAEVSNIWNSHPITEHILELKEFSKIKSEILECFIEYLKQSNMLRDNLNITIEFCSSWINVHKYGQRQEYHNHTGINKTKFSGVYYVDVTDKTGDICFRHPNYTMLTVWAYPELQIECYKTITPTNGKIIIFPSWLDHMVYKNTDTIDRVSIAFNINVSLF